MKSAVVSYFHANKYRKVTIKTQSFNMVAL